MRKITMSAALLAALTVPALAAAGNTLVWLVSDGTTRKMVMTADGTGANRPLAQVCEDAAAFWRSRGLIASCE